jgi:hypothetical protein
MLWNTTDGTPHQYNLNDFFATSDDAANGQAPIAPGKEQKDAQTFDRSCECSRHRRVDPRDLDQRARR